MSCSVSRLFPASIVKRRNSISKNLIYALQQLQKEKLDWDKVYVRSDLQKEDNGKITEMSVIPFVFHLMCDLDTENKSIKHMLKEFSTPEEALRLFNGIDLVEIESPEKQKKVLLTTNTTGDSLTDSAEMYYYSSELLSWNTCCPAILSDLYNNYDKKEVFNSALLQTLVGHDYGRVLCTYSGMLTLPTICACVVYSWYRQRTELKSDYFDIMFTYFNSNFGDIPSDKICPIDLLFTMLQYKDNADQEEHLQSFSNIPVMDIFMKSINEDDITLGYEESLYRRFEIGINIICDMQHLWDTQGKFGMSCIVPYLHEIIELNLQYLWKNESNDYMASLLGLNYKVLNNLSENKVLLSSIYQTIRKEAEEFIDIDSDGFDVRSVMLVASLNPVILVGTSFGKVIGFGVNVTSFGNALWLYKISEFYNAVMRFRGKLIGKPDVLKDYDINICNAINTRYLVLLNERKNIYEEVMSIVGTLSTLFDTLSSNEKSIIRLTEEKKKLKNDVKSLNKDIDEYKRSKNALNAKVVKLESKLNEIEVKEVKEVVTVVDETTKCELQEAKAEIENLIGECVAYETLIEEYKDRVEVLMEENDYLRSTEDEYLDTDDIIIEDDTSNDVELSSYINVLRGIDIVIVGGDPIHSKLKDAGLTNVKYISANVRTVSADSIANFDYVFCCVKFLSHSLMYAASSACAAKNVPLHRINTFSVSTFVKSMFNFIYSKKG